ncbi:MULTISPECIES: hypothetical protein [Haloferax]|uniref:Uncharacterized protein n=1 Tax=Haloferax massiliensis TaxID=1476858 RepID=A0A0D6JNY3_9EURY|nr:MULTISPECIES: hypothetical protein [Haloferax]MDS0242597.1 hypothetical protein [Haloferax sp. S2CR25]MDS0445718.1 hypothetical protein [Haloferax sp. S2CR25-2]CQR49305.1 hypothetical protein BN996_00765 [Haloferax massiliensis]
MDVLGIVAAAVVFGVAAYNFVTSLDGRFARVLFGSLGLVAATLYIVEQFGLAGVLGVDVAHGLQLVAALLLVTVLVDFLARRADADASESS